MRADGEPPSSAPSSPWRRWSARARRRPPVAARRLPPAPSRGAWSGPSRASNGASAASSSAIEAKRCVRILGHRPLDDELERVGQIAAQRLRARRLVPDDAGERAARVLAAERRTPGDGAIEHGAERVDVAAMIDRRAAARLLRRHVRGRAEHRAGARQLVLLLHLGDAEVEQLGDVAAVAVVPGALTSMTFSGLRSRCTTPAACAAREAAGHLPRDVRGARDRQRAFAVEQRAQIFAVDELVHEVRLPVARGVDVEHLRHVRALRSSTPRSPRDESAPARRDRRRTSGA